MTDELPVHISREELHALEVPASFEASGPFDVRLINHGESVHIHLHLDDALSQVAEIDAGNHFIEGDSERFIRVNLDADSAAEGLIGKLKVASAYGATTRWIDIEVSEPDDEDEGVTVDQSLSRPQQPVQEEPSLLSRPEIPVLFLAGFALVISAVVAVIIQHQLVLVGSLVVLVGVLLALFFLLRDLESA